MAKPSTRRRPSQLRSLPLHLGVALLRPFPTRVARLHPLTVFGDVAGTLTILDCYYIAEREAFAAVDILCWNGTYFYDCAAEMRFWMLAQKLSEVSALRE